MRARTVALSGILVLAVGAGWLSTAPLAGQAPRRGSSAGLPRTRDGHADLQGVYDVATITPLERPANVKSLVMSDEEAARLENGTAAVRARADEPIDGNRKAPPVGGDGSTGAAGGVG